MPTPHDKLFKAIFGRPENAASELRYLLPQLEQIADLNSLRLVPGSFVDRRFRERHTDLLFAVDLWARRSDKPRSAFVYCLLEHQSTLDVWMALRLLGYMLRIWEAFRIKHPKATELPVIIPVVIHHSDTGWTASTQFADLFGDSIQNAGLEDVIPRFNFLLDDVSRTSDAELSERRLNDAAAVALWALRDARNADNF